MKKKATTTVEAKDVLQVKETVTETTEEEDTPSYSYYPPNGGVVYTNNPAIFGVSPDVACTSGYCEVKKEAN